MSADDAWRVGHGFDLHRIEPGGEMVLGGERFRCGYRIVAHSDGDVLVHALCDALLGAAGLGDLGRHFPDSDPAHRDADSLGLLRTVMGLLDTASWRVGNADLTLLAEVPRLGEARETIRERLASALEITTDEVNVKATTLEGLGEIGRREAVAAHAVALLRRR